MSTPDTDASGNSSDELIVKFMYRGIYNEDSRVGWLRQFPKKEPLWGRCRFTFDPDARNYDWLVVYHDLPGTRKDGKELTVEKLACPQHNTLHVTHEPSSITTYGEAYQRQYGHVLTSQEPSCVRHPNAIYSHPGFPWYYGRSFSGKGLVDYDTLASMDIPAKTKLLSTVCSSKAQKHTVHKKRYEFTQRLKEVIPELDIFGHGVRPIDDKAEALNAYKYHLAFENHFSPHHWTEKLSDSFLGFSVPIYAGSPNASDYFPVDSFVPINPDDFDGAVSVIRNLLHEDSYEQRFQSVLEARRRVLKEYNLFAILSRQVERLHKPGIVQGEEILCRKAFWKANPMARLQCIWEKSRRMLLGRMGGGN